MALVAKKELVFRQSIRECFNAGLFERVLPVTVRQRPEIACH